VKSAAPQLAPRQPRRRWAATLAAHPNATASAHPAARWSATWASAMQSPVPGNDTTGPRDRGNH
jgi:hypothetical protein